GRWSEPEGPGVRVDAGYSAGNRVTPFYDPLLAKLCVHGTDRADALTRAVDAVAEFEIDGIQTNLPFLARLLTHAGYRDGRYDTGIVEQLLGSV
ncbi:MAG: biotin carboxylase, partial [Actinomycetota bacterium]|nr:biotin carboxylase [Actinomycetota bacterium]